MFWLEIVSYSYVLPCVYGWSMQRFEARVHLATVALVSFILAFTAARIFTTFFPDRVLISGGLHIHHFWFGIALMAVGGWLGINYRHKDVDVIAAILYGVGGGLIVDEVGLLLTFNDYWSGLTWTILGFLLPFSLMLVLFSRYRKKITDELDEFATSKLSFTLGIFLVALSVGFLLQTNNPLVIISSSALTVIGAAIVFLFLIQRLMKAREKKSKLIFSALDLKE